MTQSSHAHIGEATDRSGFAGARRMLFLALVLCLAVLHSVPSGSGSALGQVRSITPDEITSSQPIGWVFEPSMSYRGEVAGVHDREVNQVGFVQLDVAGADAMFGARGMTVSGDGCMALTVVTRPATTAVLFDFTIIDRCRGLQRAISGAGTFYDRESSLALSHTGRFAAVQFENSDDVGPPSNVSRIDTETLERMSLPLPSGWHTEAQYGLDISDTGRFIAVTLSNFQQMEVAVWDVQTDAVTFVSAPGGPAGGWASFPSISGDGNWVSFASSRPRGLGEVDIGPWVYVANRSNGAARLASAAGGASYYSSLSRDGSQVAYTVSDRPGPIIVLPTITFPTFPIIIGPITTPPPIILRAPEGTSPVCDYNQNTLDDLEFDCPPDRVNVAFSATPGFTGSFQVETVSLDANNRVIGEHLEPALSGNGRWVSWVSDVGDALLGTSRGLNGAQHAFMRRRDPGLSISPVDFGTASINEADPADRNAVVRNTGRTSVSIDSIVPPSSPFSVVGGSCNVGGSIPPGATCTVRIRFRPNGVVDSWNSTVRVAEIGYDAIAATGRIVGASTTGPGSIPPDPGSAVLTADPNPADFGAIEFGAASAAKTITVSNIGGSPGLIGTALDGDPAEFFVQENNCAGTTLAPTASCTMDVVFFPKGGGARTATLTASTDGSSVDIELTGDGIATPQLNADPPAVDYGGVIVGFSTDDVTITITNDGNGAGTLLTTLTGPHPDDFFVRVNNCVNETLQPGDTCTMDIAMFPRNGGNRTATLTVSTTGSAVDVPLSGQGRYEPELRASPEAVTERGITILIGQGFPPNEPFTIEIRDDTDTAITTLGVTSDTDGRFREPFSPLATLDLGAYTLHIDPRPNVYDRIDEPLVVVLPTFQPQGPTGPAFNNNLLVARG